MAPKAVARVVTKRLYRARSISVPAPAPVRARIANRQAAMRSRPGKLYLCPLCSYPRYIPNAAKCNYKCAMPRVRLPGGDWFQCLFTTKANSWRRQKKNTPEYEEAAKLVLEAAVCEVEAKEIAGTLDGTYFGALKREIAARIAACQQPQQTAAIALAGAVNSNSEAN